MRELPYRARQFFNAITARVTSEDLKLVQSILPEDFLHLYQNLPTSDQAHSLRVLRHLMEDGHMHSNLLQSGLLHDLGKSRFPLRIWERIWVVVAGWFSPSSRVKWRNFNPRGFKRALVVEAMHAEWGAQMVADAGGDDQLQRLIHYHADSPEQLPQEERHLLIALQIADSAS